MHLILTGATGLVGSSALHAMLKMRDVTKISILSRRPVPMAEQSQDPRVDVLILNDFTTYSPEVLRKLEGASGAVWALGISQTKASKECIFPKDIPFSSSISSNLSLGTTSQSLKIIPLPRPRLSLT